MKTTDEHWEDIKMALLKIWLTLIAIMIILALTSCSIQRNYKDSDQFKGSDTIYQARMGGLWEYDSLWTKVDTVK